MIVDERMLDYILSLDRDESPLVRTIEQEAVRDYVPIIRKESRNLLKVLLKIKKPGAVLEVGTAIGFSAVLMAECLTGDSHITTIEKYEKRIPIARRNFQRAGMEAKITLLEGDAAEVMKGLDGPYDFIFMDAAKGQYIRFLPEVLRLLAPGGLLVSDNVLQDGDVVESRYAVVRRNRTIHSRMREYLWTLKHMDGLETMVLPIGDGMTVSVKEKKNKKTRIINSGQQPGSFKNGSGFWCGCRIYWRRGIQPPRKVEKFLYGRYAGRNRLCPCPWSKSLCDGQYPGP